MSEWVRITDDCHIQVMPTGKICLSTKYGMTMIDPDYWPALKQAIETVLNDEDTK